MVRQMSNLPPAGVYSFVRHLIYSDTLLVFLGLSIAFRVLISLLYWLLVAEYSEEYASNQLRVNGGNRI